MRPNNLSSYLTKLGSIITALADLINTFTLASYAAQALLDKKNDTYVSKKMKYMRRATIKTGIPVLNNLAIYSKTLSPIRRGRRYNPSRRDCML